jgi:hypothetical protein
MAEMPESGGNAGEAGLVEAAGREVGRLIKANKVNRRVIAALSVISVLVMAACGVLAWVAADQHNDDRQLRQASIMSCQSGNSFRSEQTEIWNDFIGLLVNKSTSRATLAIAHDFLGYVGHVDALRNCGQLYAGGG